VARHNAILRDSDNNENAMVAEAHRAG
jgi:hypothetical protein